MSSIPIRGNSPARPAIMLQHLLLLILQKRKCLHRRIRKRPPLRKRASVLLPELELHHFPIPVTIIATKARVHDHVVILPLVALRRQVRQPQRVPLPPRHQNPRPPRHGVLHSVHHHAILPR